MLLIGSLPFFGERSIGIVCARRVSQSEADVRRAAVVAAACARTEPGSTVLPRCGGTYAVGFLTGVRCVESRKDKQEYEKINKDMKEP